MIVAAWKNHSVRWQSGLLQIWLFFAAATISFSVGAAALAWGQESPTTLGRYMNGLRQRGLYTLAEGYCLRKLSDPDLPAEERLPLVLELSRTYAEHAQQASPDQQAELWEQAEQVLRSEVLQVQSSTDRLALEIQILLTTVARAEQLRWQWELNRWDDALRKQSLRLLSQAVPELSKREADVLRELAVATKPGSPASSRQVRSLQSLLFHTRRGLLQALLTDVALYDEGSPERASVLLEAERCARRLSSGVPTLEASAERELYLATVYRLQKRYSDARRVLENVDAQHRAALGDAFIAEKARLLLDQGKAPDAAEQIIERLHSGGRLPGELAYLLVRSLLAMQQLAENRGDRAAARDAEEQIAAVIAQTIRNGETYWAARCRQLADRLSASNRWGQRLAPLVERAKGFYGLGQLQAAAVAYEQAARAALQEQRTDAAFDLEYTAASIWLKKGDYAAAIRGLDTLLTELPDHPQAAQAHLLKLLAMAQYLRQRQQGSASDAADGDAVNSADSLQARYLAALEEHRRRFRSSPTYYEATWLLAVARESAGDYEQAVSLYAEIPSNHRRADDAHLGMARCYAKLIEQAGREGPGEVERWRASATEHLQKIVSMLPASPKKLTTKQIEFLLQLAELLLGADHPNYAAADRLLERAVDWLRPTGQPTPRDGQLGSTEGEPAGHEQGQGSSSVVHGLRGKNDTAHAGGGSTEGSQRTKLFQRAMQLRVVSLAAQGRWTEAGRALAELPAEPPDNLLRVLNGLTDLARSAGPLTQRQLGQLQLAASERLLANEGKMSETQRQWLLRCRAEGFAATGQTERAVELYERLLRAVPDDTELLKTTAELCVQSNRTDVLSRGKILWQQLVSRLRPGSREWFEARYKLALTCYRLGDSQTCAKLLAVTRLVYGWPKDPQLRQQFERLELQSRNATGSQRPVR